MADDSTGLQSKQLQTASQRERFCGYRQMGNICYHLSLTGRDESEDQITHLPGMNDGMPLPAATRSVMTIASRMPMTNAPYAKYVRLSDAQCEQLLQQTKASGCNQVMIKPLDFAALTELLGRILLGDASASDNAPADRPLHRFK